MDHTELIFQDLLLYHTNKVPENHNQFFHFCHGGETHFLVLAQTFMSPQLLTPPRLEGNKAPQYRQLSHQLGLGTPGHYYHHHGCTLDPRGFGDWP